MGRGTDEDSLNAVPGNPEFDMASLSNQHQSSWSVPIFLLVSLTITEIVKRRHFTFQCLRKHLYIGIFS